MYEYEASAAPVGPLCTCCSYSLKPGAGFCGGCGSPVPQPEPDIPGPPQPRPLRTRDFVLIELVSWIPLLNVCLWLIWMFRKHPQRARAAQAKLITSCALVIGAAVSVAVLAALVRYGVLDTLPLPSLGWR